MNSYEAAKGDVERYIAVENTQLLIKLILNDFVYWFTIVLLNEAHCKIFYWQKQF